MVTIEQKLTLFSKLMKQDISEEVKERRDEIERKYDELRATKEKEAEIKSQKYIEDYLKNSTIKNVEQESQIRLATKKKVVEAKEKLIAQILEEVKLKVQNFITTSNYETFLQNQVIEISTFIKENTNIILLLSVEDGKRHEEKIQEFLKENNISNVTFDTTSKIQLGGFILNVPEKNIQIDMTIDRLIEDKKEGMVEQILEEIEKGSDSHVA
ncbi:hypothetical protein AN639_08460 [Candidatus Epulonipiscium fishelsonii]|uniref:Uncharacterized protein n=1 Tax=Candidatus Epulonipiscium fishelsonii TaxID=77094 RepID=A0ACC8XGA5_9FIRM|nr:hypothetical protein AN639_08460 [Epulopiscium sp. SCG-B05WGA-EpuloA1]ONI42489.1 hypothetical protein AN396_14245 [Epulopiscium sp. SCG-B11WGA-EpuloA1]